MLIRCPSCQGMADHFDYTDEEEEVWEACLCRKCGAWLVLQPQTLWRDSIALLEMFNLHPYLGEESIYAGLDFFIGTEENHDRVQTFYWCGSVITAFTSLNMSHAEGWHAEGGGWSITI